MNNLKAARPFILVPNCPGVTYDEYHDRYATVGPRPTVEEMERFNKKDKTDDDD